MTTTTVIRCRGIGEPAANAPTLLHQVTDRLPRDRYRPIELAWSAQYGPVPATAGESFASALADGRIRLLQEIEKAPGPVALLGYSGGASLAGNVAQEIGRGDHPHLAGKVTAAGLVADPAMPRGQAANGSFGVTGDRHTDGIPTRWLWDERDPIPCTPDRSPLRTIADQTSAMSLVDPAAWGADLLDRLRRGRWQPSAWDWRDVIGSIQRYGHALEQAQFYLTGGHVAAYLGAPLGSLTRWLVDETR